MFLLVVVLLRVRSLIIALLCCRSDVDRLFLKLQRSDFTDATLQRQVTCGCVCVCSCILCLVIVRLFSCLFLIMLVVRSWKAFLNTLRVLFKKNMIRHHKDQTFNGRAILLSLPPKHVREVVLEFSARERKAYDDMHTDAKAAFEEAVALGTAVKNTIQILQMLVPLRRACSGGLINLKEIGVRFVFAFVLTWCFVFPAILIACRVHAASSVVRFGQPAAVHGGIRVAHLRAHALLRNTRSVSVNRHSLIVC